MKSGLILSSVVMVLFCFAPACADESWQAAVPEKLKAWVPWVLRNDDLEICTATNEDRPAQVCVWYPRASIRIDRDRAEFSQDLLLEKDGWAILPYGDYAWPTAVKAGDRVVPVLARRDAPAVWLKKGVYRISGELPLKDCLLYTSPSPRDS